MWAHQRCAAWSEGVTSSEDGNLKFVDQAVFNGLSQVCFKFSIPVLFTYFFVFRIFFFKRLKIQILCTFVVHINPSDLLLLDLYCSLESSLSRNAVTVGGMGPPLTVCIQSAPRSTIIPVPLLGPVSRWVKVKVDLGQVQS